MTYAPARLAPLPDADTTTHRNVTKWIVGLALFFTLFAFLSALQIFQITSEGPSERTLRRALAVVSEIDVLLDRHYDDLRQRAEAADAGETVELQDFPVAVSLTAEEVRTQSRDELRAALLQRGADVLYDEGTGAMRAEESSGDVAVFSVGGSVDRSLNLLREDVHRAAAVAMIVLGVIAVLLAGLLVMAARGSGRFIALSVVALAASAALLLVAVVVRLGIDASGSDEYVRAEFAAIAKEIAWAPIRNGVILVALTASVTAIGVVVARAGEDGKQRTANSNG